MPTKSSTTALQAAIKGDRVTDRQAKSALGAAVDRISSLTRRAERSKDAMVATGTQVVHTAETHGSLFLSSMAEGYLGSERLKFGNVDVRAPVGILAAGYGLYETMSGRNGGHALAIGNGVLGSWLASVGMQAGQTLANRRPGFVVPDTPVRGAMPLSAEPREVLLTPDGHEVRLTPEPDRFDGPTRRRADHRFVHAHRTSDADQAFEDGNYDAVLEAGD